MIISIDPGCLDSAYVVMEADYKPVEFGKVKNEEIFTILLANKFEYRSNPKILVIEQIASYGMAVGAEVFETCVWSGRFWEFALANDYKVDRLYRKDVKINLCGTMKAKDANIRQALIDRFGEVGTKANKGWFYGFKADIWQSYACGATYLDLNQNNLAR